MKKTLVAMAALSAIGAFAQSSVTMYGVVEATVDVGYKSQVTTNNYTVNPAGTVLTLVPATSGVATTKAGFRVQDGNSQGVGTSRIGWRGVEDLGGGLKANYQLEMGLRVDDGCAQSGAANCTNSGNSGGQLFGRNAWVGASGGFGEIRLGRQVLGSFGVQGNSWAAGSSSGLYEVGAVSPAMGGVRFADAIRYLTPNMGGISGSVALRAPESNVIAANTVGVTSNAKQDTGFDMHVQYANGPLYLGFGYNKVGNDTTTNSTPGVAGNIVGVTTSDTKGTTFGASYNLGVVQPFFNYSRQVTSGATSLVVANTVGATNVTHKGWTLGAKAPMGALTLIAGYGKGDISNLATSFNSVSTAAQVSLTDSNLKAFQIGAQYSLSKRTMLEVNYGTFKRDDANAVGNATTVAGVIVAGAGTAQTVNTKVNALNIGLRHSF